MKHILSYFYIIQSPNTSPLTCHDHLPFAGHMYRDVQRSSSNASESVCPPERHPPGLGLLVVDLIICGVNGDAAHQGVPLPGVSHHLPKHDEAGRGSRRVESVESVESVGHLLVPLSPHVDHRRSATPQPALRRTGASSGSLSLMDLFLLKAFARASLQR